MPDEHGSDIPEQRKYLPTLAELVDRLSIVLLKSIFISEHRAEYLKERDLIEHDIGALLWPRKITGLEIRAILMLGITNRFIWENESRARKGGVDQDRLLKSTHSVNGVRNTAKNVISAATGGRQDFKIDALAADLPAEFGNWRVFE